MKKPISIILVISLIASMFLNVVSFTSFNSNNQKGETPSTLNINNKDQYYRFDNIDLNEIKRKDNLYFPDNLNKQKELTREIINDVNYPLPAYGVYATSDDDNYDFSPEEISVKTRIERDQWNWKEYESLKLNYLEYANSKSNFVNKYKYVTISLWLMDNFWNKKRGWTWSGGKTRKEFTFKQFKIEIKGKDNNTEIWRNTDEKHRSNETTSLEVREEWNEIDKTFKLKLSTWAKVNWKKGSTIHHSAIIKIKNPQFHFRNTEEDNNEKFKPYFPQEIYDQGINFRGGGKFAGFSTDFAIFNSIPQSSSEIKTAPLFKDSASIGKQRYKAIATLNQSYTFTNKYFYNFKWYSQVIFMFSDALSLMSLDINVLLNQNDIISHVLGGSLKYHIKGNYGYFSYTSKIFNATQRTNPVYIEPSNPKGVFPLAWVGFAHSTYYYEEE